MSGLFEWFLNTRKKIFIYCSNSIFWRSELLHLILESRNQDFIGQCNYFTVDVAEEIGKQVDEKDVAEYLEYCERFMKPFEIPGITEKITVTHEEIEKIARQYLAAVLSLEKLYRRLQSEMNTPFVLELSIDETEKPR
ncbi:hypothetical protein L6248_01475 [Candidatus Parcubacteria bacterium]|nr:hypothetical protein [Candidatus Parcubacteria bacterium]